MEQVNPKLEEGRTNKDYSKNKTENRKIGQIKLRVVLLKKINKTDTSLDGLRKKDSKSEMQKEAL